MVDGWQGNETPSTIYNDNDDTSFDMDEEISDFGDNDNTVRQSIEKISAINLNSRFQDGGNLHHRRSNTNQVANNNREQEEPQNIISNNYHQFRSVYNNNNLNIDVNHGNNTKQKRWRQRRGYILKILLFLFIVNYLVLIMQGNAHLRDTIKLEDTFLQSLSASQASLSLAASRASFFGEPRGRLHIVRERTEQRQLDERIKVKRNVSNRANKRALRTTPPPPLHNHDESYEELHKYNDFMLMDEEPRRNGKENPSDDIPESKPAKPKDLCGAFAKKAAVDNPKNFLARDVLNSKSRVLITGVLNPIGFQLALTLKEKCGVEVMAGIDPAFPNTVTHRTELLKRIQLLTTNIPKFIQPVAIPLVGLDTKPNKNKIQQTKKISFTDETSLLNMNPTHIVHLSSYSITEYQDFGSIADDELRNAQSPYIRPGGHVADMFAIRSSLVSMEQILSSISESEHEEKGRPHFVYASMASLGKSSAERKDISDQRNKLVDEVLADTYNSLHQIYSVGVRLPDMVFGPWARDHSPIHDLAEASIAQQRTQNGTHITIKVVDDILRDYVYVEDIIEGIIVSMQYREEDESSTLFDFSSGRLSNLTEVNNFFSNVLATESQSTMIDVASLITTESDLMLRTKEILKWSIETSLAEGLKKTIAWHLDRIFPYGDRIDKDRALATGDEFRKKVGLETCSPNEILCHLGQKYMPCSSECSNKKECVPSVFDSVFDLMKEATEGCDIVLYTQSIGYDVRDLKLSSVYEDQEELMICNFAFVPEDSHLVRAAVDKVPENHLKSFGVSPTEEDLRDESQFRRHKIKKLNGRLLYKGWIIIWVKGAERTLTTNDKYLLKLSPGNLFHSDVKYAIFVDENFPMSPKPDDVKFLVAQTYRPALPDRSAYRRNEKGEKIKYRLAAEPERRAVIVLSPLKYKKVTETGEPAKISVLEATKYMQVEMGENPEEKESSSLKKQREFYERARSFVNRADFRSNMEAWYKYEFKDYARTRWIVHDMWLEDGRQLRCDWYQEHIQWDNNLDQLTFAHITTLREIERRISFQEPDDHIKPDYITHPELLYLSDSHEWHALESEENRVALKDIPLETFSIIADHMVDKDEKAEKGEEDGLTHNINLANSQKEGLPLYIRIVSEHVMMRARASWAKEHGSEK